MSRPTHYASVSRGGRPGLNFLCYRIELRAYLDGHTLGENIPRPRRSTDLRKVTCATCWREIEGMSYVPKHTLSLREIKDGTGFDRNARFVQVQP